MYLRTLEGSYLHTVYKDRLLTGYLVHLLVNLIPEDPIPTRNVHPTAFKVKRFFKHFWVDRKMSQTCHNRTVSNTRGVSNITG